jgi:hypothetical protein
MGPVKHSRPSSTQFLKIQVELGKQIDKKEGDYFTNDHFTYLAVLPFVGPLSLVQSRYCERDSCLTTMIPDTQKHSPHSHWPLLILTGGPSDAYRRSFWYYFLIEYQGKISGGRGLVAPVLLLWGASCNLYSLHSILHMTIHLTFFFQKINSVTFFGALA